MTEEVYNNLPPVLRSEMQVINVEPKDFDYSFSHKWNLAKSESSKAYKKLKKIEFEIRNENRH